MLNGSRRCVLRRVDVVVVFLKEVFAYVFVRTVFLVVTPSAE